MEKIRLGRTGLMVTRLGFGGVPMQKLTEREAVAVVRRGLERSINFFDTAAEYTNGEICIGKAIEGYRRDELIISTKSDYGTRQMVESNLERSLKNLGTDYIDLFQFHQVNNEEALEAMEAGEGPMAAINEAKKAGVIRHFGITSHSLDFAKIAVKSGLFETVMFGLNFVCTEAADELLPLARQHDVGFIAMKPLAGGMLASAAIPFKYLQQFPDVLALPGMQRPEEVDEIVGLYENPKPLTAAEQAEMKHLREELTTRFCRRCNLCESCPQNVPIVHAMDIICFIKNMPDSFVFGEDIAGELKNIASCDRCGECEKLCPYGIRIMDILQEFYNIYLAEYRKYRKQAAA